MLFFVEAVNKENKNKYVVIEVEDENELFENIQYKTLTLINYYQLPSSLSPFLSEKNIKIKPEEVIEIIDNLHLIIKSGLPLHSGLIDLALDSNNKKFQTILLNVAEDLNRGHSLSHAFSQYNKSFNSMIINLIKIGEASGQLDSTLKTGSIFLKKTLSLKKKVKQALIYPSFAFATVFAAMLVWMLYVLPEISVLFKQMDVPLPALTIFIMDASNFLTNYIVHLLVSIVSFVIFFKIIHKKYFAVRLNTDKFLLKLPVVKHIISGYNMSFISEYLRLAIVSGLPFFTALENLKENIDNEVFKKAIQEATEDVIHGHQLSAAFKKTKMFSPLMLRMMNAGEESGALDTQLEFISEYYNEKVNYFAENIGKVIEPLILLFVGGFMAVIMMGLMGPIYDLISQINK